ncbi:Olfactory receptor 52R1 [Galemys pyrenaicus]|uniref:Olfactory receptor 52R1 n=1 Tax=Galemys pyrenaicus TaxID=202257 RepID=A0A8J6DWX0_GALPY|nr:Olfactory receptor 52R1 [Galemys pyrenaicus]
MAWTATEISMGKRSIGKRSPLPLLIWSQLIKEIIVHFEKCLNIGKVLGDDFYVNHIVNGEQFKQPVMAASGNSSSHPDSFFLVGVPGLENSQFGIGFLFCAMYIVAVVGNITVIHIIRIDHTLHEPMYLFLAMLASTDLVLSSSTQPKMLAIFWFHSHEIEYHACLMQVFFIHAFSSVESGVLMAMALDRYVAICFPLRHSSILTPSAVCKLGAAVMIRGLLWVSPFCFMISRMPFCSNKTIPQSYCEHVAVLHSCQTLATI